ncbi:CARDB domain-containing protein [Bacillus alkalicellulosilyticus]|uniref:CARDB domain-containing protein n=1 Tax=Alkalihalobacterium alkalicellulosilyticum TaxID=1912214 RepID=UPI000996DA0F|nr:CARDB domain-containing protein [Bacillus alkalicellulosilyticus]
MQRKIFFCFLILIIMFSSFPNGVLFSSNSSSVEAASQTKTIRIDRGTYSNTMQWESSKIYNFPNASIGNYPSTYVFEEGGYKGTLQATRIILTPLNRQTNRSVTLTDTWTDSTFRIDKNSVPVPNTRQVTHTDSVTGTTITRNLPKNGELRSIDSRVIKAFSYSYGRGDNYDPVGNTTLGYMSNNTTTYWGGTLRYSNAPRPPNDYYGPDASTYGTKGWTLESIAWDECCVRDARDSRYHHLTRNDGYRWRSDASNGRRTYNQYRKGVVLAYSRNVTGHKYRQSYRGTYSLPDTATRWKVEVEYTGTIHGTNLRANSIDIFNPWDGRLMSGDLTQGVSYHARVQYINNGSTNVGAHTVALYNGNTRLGEIRVPNLQSGRTHQVTIPFTPTITNSHYDMNLRAVVDDRDEIKETNENDNETSISKRVNFVNLRAINITIRDLNFQPVTTVTPGMTYRAYIFFANEGAPVGAHFVHLLSGTNRLLGSRRIGGLGTGASGEIWIEFTAPHDSTEFIGFVDAIDEIVESNEFDNTVSTTGLVHTRNLVAESLEFFDNDGNLATTLIQGETYEVRYTHRNDSLVGTPGRRDSFHSYGFNTPVNIDVGPMQPGERRTERFSFTPTRVGEKISRIHINSFHDINETNYNDNTAINVTNVTQINLKALNITLTDTDHNLVSTLRVDNEYLARITYNNESDLPVEGHTVTLFDGEQIIGEHYVESLLNNRALTITIPFTLSVGGNRTLTAFVDSEDDIKEHNETDNKVSTTRTVLDTNLKALDIYMTDLNNEPVESLVRDKEYIAHITYLNDSSQSIPQHTVRLTEGNTTLVERRENAMIAGAERTISYRFTARNTGTHTYTAILDPDDEIIERTTEDNRVSTSFPVHYVNLRADNIRITDLNDNNVTELTQGFEYHAVVTYTNQSTLEVLPHYISLTDNSGQIVEVPVEEIASGEMRTVRIPFIAENNGTQTFIAMVDSKDDIVEANENDNTVSINRIVRPVNLRADNIEITDKDNNPISTLVQGYEYHAHVTYTNESNISVPEHVVGIFDEGHLIGELSSAAMQRDETKTIVVPFIAEYNGERTIWAFVDIYDEIVESTLLDNEVSTNKIINFVNLKATDIIITDMNDNEMSTLVQGIQYRAHVSYENESDIPVPSHHVSISSDNSQLHERAVTSMERGQTRTTTFTFTASERGTVVFSGMTDSRDMVQETDETDNEVFVTKDVHFVNLKAEDIVITDMNNVPTDTLVHNIEYVAHITYKNESEISVPAHYISLHENGNELNDISVGQISAGQSRTVEIPFLATQHGERTFTGIVDSRDQIIETDETDNEVSTTVSVNIVNLVAESIDFINETNEIQSHLVKGESYYARITYLNDSEIDVPSHHVSLSEQGQQINEVEAAPMRSGERQTVLVEFTAEHAGANRLFEGFVDSRDVIVETDETDNTISQGMLVNTRPDISMSYLPVPVYQGDEVTIIMIPTDEDGHLLDVELIMEKGDSDPEIVYTAENITSGTELEYVIPNIDLDRYTFTSRVRDELGEEAEVSLTFDVLPLTIEGAVTHTEEWEEIHEKNGNLPHQFYSGEPFILDATLTDYPINYVKVTFMGEQQRGTIKEISTYLEEISSISYVGDIFDETLIEGDTSLKNGDVTFEFEVEYANGFVATDIVIVEIIGRLHDAFRFRQTF